MNKIFKVIWSKARNCYVVVSELAKSHDDGHVRRSRSVPKKLLQAAGLDLLIRKILPQNLDRRPLIWQYPISVIFWKK